MIVNFANKSTEDIYNGINLKAARRIPASIWKIAARKLDMINAARELRDLQIPPANRLESLKRNWAGRHAIRINDQYRVVFRWIDGNAKDVMITDYH